MSIVLSVLPVKYCDTPSDGWTIAQLNDFVKWFQQTFTVDTSQQAFHHDMVYFYIPQICD